MYHIGGVSDKELNQSSDGWFFNLSLSVPLTTKGVSPPPGKAFYGPRVMHDVCVD